MSHLLKCILIRALFVSAAVLVVCLPFSQAISAQTGNAVDLSPETKAVRERAFAELRAGRWPEAERLFDTISEIANEDPLSLYGSALAKFNVGKVAEADSRVSAAILELEADGSGNGLLADCLVLSALVSARSGKNFEAVPKLRRAVELVPDHFDAVFSLARALFGDGDLRNAAFYFRKAVDLRPGDLQARFFLATSLEDLGETGAALKEYRSIVAADPENVNGNLGLGVLLIKTEGDRSAEGLNSLRKVIKLNGRNYEARITLGKALIGRKQLEEAIEHLKVAAELAPGNPEPFYQLALAYRRTGNKAESERSMEKVRAIHQARRGAPGDQ